MTSYNPASPDFPFTLGIEEEYQVVDPQTRELRSYITQILDRGRMILREQIKPELHQSMVEVGTQPCRTIQEARAEVVRLRGTIAGLARQHGLTIISAGTHPISSWMSQEITPFERYKGVVEEMQQLALQLLIFGMHVHVGMPDDEVAIELMNVARYFLPHILALSTSSPFWMGRNTGFKSYRSALFSNFPRTGIPPSFHSAAEFQNYVKLLIKTNCIDDAKKIYWDLRPHPYFGTLEFRVCDAATRVDECIALAALMQALVVKLHLMFSENTTFRVYRRAVIMENKWRAQRWGLDGKLIDFGKRAEVEAKALMHELVAFVDEVVDELGSRHEVEYLLNVADGGSSADRQLAVFRQTNDLHAVVDNLIVETLEGVPVYQG
ncbi:carboxylate-amine ligase [Roseiflexus sp.]|uniref:carboxylate-amine ligase n=1 Tax=Roseiflexus sp. TaxID=2562120 RepID=UPI0021DD5404|nr:carboxylate-amine ligase [Roseiflexus sp.]GIW00792.1 MAG: putative glutamate--cysteine ligase 2 [Roseiflexus sp.]